MVVNVAAVDAATVGERVEGHGLLVTEVANLFAAGVIADLFWIAEASATAELLAANDAVGEFHFHFHSFGVFIFLRGAAWAERGLIECRLR